jgi:hypothetical protein
MSKEDPWVMPEWMEPFRDEIRNTGGNPVEELMNDHHTKAVVNLPRTMLIVAVTSQVSMLYGLHRAGLLRERLKVGESYKIAMSLDESGMVDFHVTDEGNAG